MWLKTVLEDFFQLKNYWSASERLCLKLINQQTSSMLSQKLTLIYVLTA